MTRFFILLFVTTSLGLLSACTRTTPTTVDQNNTSAGEKPIPTYPHSANWLQNHGARYLTSPTGCTYCHGDTSASSKSKASCTKCHSSYPHSPFWAKPENHGATFAKILDTIRQNGGDPMTNECTTCHKNPMPGETISPKSAKNMSCNNCHVGVPHDSTAIQTREGETLDHMAFGNEKALQASCLSCHKANSDGTRKFMPNIGNCTMCHSYTDVKARVKWMSDTEAVKVDKLLEDLRKTQ